MPTADELFAVKDRAAAELTAKPSVVGVGIAAVSAEAGRPLEALLPAMAPSAPSAAALVALPDCAFVRRGSRRNRFRREAREGRRHFPP